ncbi:unnamed protein product [Adineta steineri]|uniref:Uncharacterized protein n=1 Tax=Adineta steineri TaxID=433720 RepID=A0A813VN82_9BILA|nr:unnamed protein product [Adineta steineri]CAF1170588.1 unnamed protein product [Adineta steineri]CAF1171944.1 unnamed protein product [Adineta steineri]
MVSSPSPQTPGSDDYLTPNEHLSLASASFSYLYLTKMAPSSQSFTTPLSRQPLSHQQQHQIVDHPLLAYPSTINSPVNIPPATTTTNSSVVPILSSPSSSSVFDGSIAHVWISFPEPLHHTYSTSNSSKRSRTSTTSAKQTTTAPKTFFSYTLYDWNFLSALSSTVLGWVCVINRLQKLVEKFLRKREKRLDAVLAYLLVETKPVSTLSQSKLYDLLTPKTKYLLSHPVCQLVTELRKQFNRNTQINMNLQPNIIPDLQLLKQGIRISCREWAQTIKPQSHKSIFQRPSSSTTTSPINSILTTTSNDQEQPSAVVRAPTMIDHVQHLIEHEFVTAHPPIRRRTIVQNTRSNTKNKYTTIEINNDLSEGDGQRASSFLADAMRRFEPTVNVSNTNGSKRLSTDHDESDFEVNTSGIRLNDTQIKRSDVKILPSESQLLINHSPLSPSSVVQFRLSHIY